MKIWEISIFTLVVLLSSCKSGNHINGCSYTDIWGQDTDNIEKTYSQPEIDAQKYYKINRNSIIVNFHNDHQKYEFLYIDEINGNSYNTVPVVSEKYIDLVEKLPDSFHESLNIIAITKELDDVIQNNEDEFIKSILMGHSEEDAPDKHCYKNPVILDYIKRFNTEILRLAAKDENIGIDF